MLCQFHCGIVDVCTPLSAIFISGNSGRLIGTTSLSYCLHSLFSFPCSRVFWWSLHSEMVILLIRASSRYPLTPSMTLLVSVLYTFGRCCIVLSSRRLPFTATNVIIWWRSETAVPCDCRFSEVCQEELKTQLNTHILYTTTAAAAWRWRWWRWWCATGA